MTPLCLIVSRDDAHVAALQRAFRANGLRLHGVADLAALRGLLSQWRFDAVLCDGEGGVDVDATLRWLRRHQRGPVVVLADAAGEDAHVAALEAGATELVARDTSPRILAVKLERLIELGAGDEAVDACRSVAFGELRLDALRAEASVRERPLRLTRGEFALLLLLATQPDRFVHRDAIVRTIGRGSRHRGESSRCADMHVCRIRRKLRDAGASSLELETVYGRGYALRRRDQEATPSPA